MPKITIEFDEISDQLTAAILETIQGFGPNRPRDDEPKQADAFDRLDLKPEPDEFEEKIARLEQEPDSAERDDNGVEFNPEYCTASKSKYLSGRVAGQWKKRRMVAQGAYDDWYQGQLGQTPVPAATATTPTTPQEFIVWVSEQQAAGTINDSHLHEAFRLAGINDIGDLFDPTVSPENIQKRIQALYGNLMAAQNRA